MQQPSLACDDTMSLEEAMVLAWLWDWAYVGVCPCFRYYSTPPAIVEGTDEVGFVVIIEAFDGVNSNRVGA